MFIDHDRMKTAKPRYRTHTPERVLELFQVDLMKFATPSFNNRREIEQRVYALNKRVALALLPMLAGRDVVTVYKLGCVLTTARCRRWESDFRSFREFIEHGPRLSYSHSMRAMRIYRHVAASGVELQRLTGVSITNLFYISQIVEPKTVDFWVSAAAATTTNELFLLVQHVDRFGLPHDADDERPGPAARAQDLQGHHEKVGSQR